MKSNHPIRLITSISLALLTFTQSTAVGAGIATIKEQSFHDDASATVIAYVELKDDGGPSIKIDTGSKVFTMDRSKLAGKIDVLSALPPNITNESELEIVRKAVNEYRDFAARFPKSAPVLANHISALEACIKAVEGGKARYNGKWIPMEEALSAKQKETQARQTEEAESTKKRSEKMAFEESQKAKGLAKYDGKWLPSDEVTRLVERSQAALAIESAAANKAEKEAAEKRRRTEKQVAEKKAADILSERNIIGVVRSITKEGLLVDSKDYASTVADSSASVGGGGNVYMPPVPNGGKRPKRAEGVFFVTGHPKQESIVDNDHIEVNAVEDGVYEYTSANGAASRVKKYRVTRTYQ